MPVVRKPREFQSGSMVSRRLSVQQPNRETQSDRRAPRTSTGIRRVEKSRTRKPRNSDSRNSLQSLGESVGESVEESSFDYDTSAIRSSRTTFAYLKPKIRNIPQETVESEWKALPAPAQQRVREILTTAKRSVVHGARSQRQSLEAEAAIDGLMKRLVKRLPRMPFPPASKDGNFDLEKLLERARTLESQLTSSIHSVELLKAEVEKEEDLLARDRQALAELEANAREESRVWQQRSKASHPLLQSSSLSVQHQDSAENIGLVSQNYEDPFDFDSPDENLAPILGQLANHLDSIQSNGQQVNGITEAISDAHVALESVLCMQNGV